MDKEKRKCSELNNAFGHTGSTISAVNSGSGFNNGDAYNSSQKTHEYGDTPNDQVQGQLNRSRLRNSKRWRKSKNNARNRPSNEETSNESTDLSEYLNQGEAFYRETGCEFHDVTAPEGETLI